MPSDPSASNSPDALAEVLIDCRLQFNAAQRRRLDWLAARKGPACVWTGRSDLPANCRLTLVVEPPNGIHLERLLATLDDEAVVVVPCGEDPAYDRLKSRLSAFGTVGVAGAAGPHQMWWGGRSRLALHLPAMHAGRLDVPSGILTTEGSSIRTCGEAPVPSPPIVPDMPASATTTAECILSNWQSSEQPVIWVDGGAGAPADIPGIEAIDCDFAVFKRYRWRFETDVLYFGRRDAAAALLRAWAVFCRHFPGLDDRILLDQAWCLLTSQLGLDTFWLPTAGGRSHPDSPPRIDPAPDHRNRADADFPVADGPAEQFLTGRLQTARTAERTGFPEVLLSVPGASELERRAIAVIRDIDGEDSHALSALIEALAAAFTAEPGGFRLLEIAICARREDLYAALQSAPVDRALVVTPKHRVAADTFRRLAEANDKIVVAPPSADVVDFTAYRGARAAADVGSNPS